MYPTLYMPVPATIERIEDETPEIKTFTIRPVEPIPFAAGQFVELAVPGIGEAPFTPSSSPSISDNMEITIMRTGRVTDWLHSMKEGDKVGVRGPMGRAYPIEQFHGREILVVGGGCGVGPLRSLLLALIDDLDKQGLLEQTLVMMTWTRMPASSCATVPSPRTASCSRTHR